MSRRALVTGGAGFVGSHLVDRLADEDWEVLVVDDLSKGKIGRLADARSRGDVTFHQMDIRTDEIVGLGERFSPDAVFHLAAQASVSASMKDPVHDAEVNVLGTLKVLEAARRGEASNLVFTSTGGAVYGAKVQLPAKESYPMRPDSAYGISKKVVEDYFRLYNDLYGIDYTIIGPANIYGPRQDPYGEAGVVAIFSRALLDGKAPTIFGTGEDTRDYVYVADIVDALVRAASAGGGLFVNIGTGIETSVNQLFKAVAGHAGFDGDPIYGPPRAGDIPRSVLDNTRAVDHLGWEPFTNLEEGIGLTVDWFKANE